MTSTAKRVPSAAVMISRGRRRRVGSEWRLRIVAGGARGEEDADDGHDLQPSSTHGRLLTPRRGPTA